MKRMLLAYLISCVACFAGDSDSRQLSDLIHSLPAREHLIADVSLCAVSNPPSDQKREATERLKKAQEGFKRLRTLLHTATSVFDYPGLIALARPYHSDFDDRYSMVLGIPPGWSWSHPQGANPDEYRITFNGRGTIIEIQPVIYKH
jgi:hypothetical protein